MFHGVSSMRACASCRVQLSSSQQQQHLVAKQHTTMMAVDPNPVADHFHILGLIALALALALGVYTQAVIKPALKALA